MTKIKICGLTRPEDILAVNEYQPDYAGFVFASSRRRIDDTTAIELKRRLDPRIAAVGVFVNEKPERIIRLCEAGIIDLIQLHGDETEEYIKGLKSCIPNQIIKAVRVRDRTQLEVLKVKTGIQPTTARIKNMAYPEAVRVRNKAKRIEAGARSRSEPETGEESGREIGGDYLLLDAYREGQYGGAGEAFDWSMVPAMGRPFFLAGGIDSGNVLQAIRRVKPYGIDVSSGVETGGYKDAAKIKELITKVRSVG